MAEYRRILLDGAVRPGPPRGRGLVAGDGRRVAADDAVHLPPVVPTKIIAVHLNHRSRVTEFGATLPPAPTYFHKPVSALVGHGGAVVRPANCKYLNYEGEVAIVIGRTCRGVPPAQAGRLHRRVHDRQRLRAARLPRHRRRVDAAGQGLGHDGAARPGPGHRLGLPRQAAAHLRQRPAGAGRVHRRDAVGHALPGRRHRPHDHPRTPATCCCPARRPTPGRCSPATWSRSRWTGSAGWPTTSSPGRRPVRGGLRRPADRERGGPLHRARRGLGVPRHPPADPGLTAGGPDGSAGLAEARGGRDRRLGGELPAVRAAPVAGGQRRAVRRRLRRFRGAAARELPVLPSLATRGRC